MARRRVRERKRVIERDLIVASRSVRPQLRRETKHSIVAIVFFMLAALVGLGLVQSGGAFGRSVDVAFRTLFGWGKWGVPFVFLWLAYVFLRPDRYAFRLSNTLGLFFLVVSATGLLHLIVPFPETTAVLNEGRGGGYVGLALSYPLRQFTGAFGAVVILAALLLVGVVLFFDTSLDRLAVGRSVFRRVAERFRSGFRQYRESLNRTPADEPRPEESSPFLVKSMPPPSASPEAAEPDVAPAPLVSPTRESQLSMFPTVSKRRRKIELPLDLLEANHSTPTAGDIGANQKKIAGTLENFGISVEMGEVRVGPTVTQYTLKPAAGVKLNTITTLANDLALSLAAHPIRIEAPIPGQSLVGIEVPNQVVAIVRLREILESEQFTKRRSNLSFALGKDVAGSPWVADLEPMPHLLIAGATGSGKSVCLNSLIVSLLYANSPDDLRLILVDPKRVEMNVYNDVPHLLTPVIHEVDETINALRWLVAEMDRRFQLLSKSGKRNVQAYNANTPAEPLPFIVLVVDELADLMAVAAREVEGAIIRLAQMARAVGIHLVLATQRPSVDVITGLIKANITSRIAFSVVSGIDSRTILDTAGADRLLGKGDMLFLSAQLSKPKRLQGALVSDAEIERVVAFLKERAQPEYVPGVTEKNVDLPLAPAAGDFGDLEGDPLLGEAKDVILRAGKASASLLQRRLRVGYARAARLLDLFEEQGIIGPGEGAKPREILISRTGYEGGEHAFASDVDDVADEGDGESDGATAR